MPCPFRSLSLLFVCTCCVASTALASSTTDEHERLALILRQLEAAYLLSSSSGSNAIDLNFRYTFDYARLSTDIDLIRQGINGYLTPSRAQPRNPPELTGHYTRSGQTQP